MVVAILGGAAGLILAIAGLHGILAYAPDDLPRLESVRIDGVVLAFTMLVSTGASIVFGFVPAWRVSRNDPQEGLRGGRGLTDGPRGHRLRSALISAEVAISVSLLIAAGLLLGSFVSMMGIDKGFDGANVLTVELSLPAAKYQQREQRAAFFNEILQRLNALPGITDVKAISNRLPLNRSQLKWTQLFPTGTNPSINEMPIGDFRFVSADYFRLMGIALREGRVFQELDRNRKVALISERTAKRLWPNQDAVGKRFRWNDEMLEVIGVVGDVHIESLRETAENQTLMAYMPYWERTSRATSLVIQTAVLSGDVATLVRNAIWQVDPDLPIPDFKTIKQIVSGTVATQRFQLLLVLAFASAAVALVSSGIYGVVSYSVAQRRNEIGIRVALGASTASVRMLVLKEGMMPVATGLVIGIAGALGFSHLLKDFLFGIKTTDPLTYGLVCAIVILSGVAACYFPARAATAVDPGTILRN